MHNLHTLARLLLTNKDIMTKLEIYEGTKFYPAVVALEVTLRCNMKCLHCGSSANNLPRDGELTIEQWKDTVDQLVDMGAEYFTLSGGEPFVWRHWRELSQHIAGKSKTLSIVSNGYLIMNDDIEFLRKIGMYNIGLSVDGLKTSHDYIRGIDGSFLRVIGAVRRFKRAGIKVVVSTSVNQINFPDLEQLKKVLEAAGADLWQVQIVNSFGRAGENRNSMLVTRQQYIEVIEFIDRSQREFREGRLRMNVMPADSVGYCHGIAADIWGDMEWCGCNAGRYVVGVKSNGDVVGCLSLQDSRFVSGNVKQQSFADIWGSDEAFAYNRHFNPDSLKGGCSGCSKGEQCRGGCLAMGYSISGELNSNPYCMKAIKEQAVL